MDMPARPPMVISVVVDDLN